LQAFSTLHYALVRPSVTSRPYLFHVTSARSIAFIPSTRRSFRSPKKDHKNCIAYSCFSLSSQQLGVGTRTYARVSSRLASLNGLVAHQAAEGCLPCRAVLCASGLLVCFGRR
jgi:hypothetical protein